MSARPQAGSPQRAQGAPPGGGNGYARPPLPPGTFPAVPAPPAGRDRSAALRRNALRLVTLLLVAGAGFAVFWLVAPALDPTRSAPAREAAGKLPAAPAAAEEPAAEPAVRRAPASLRPSVFRLESPAGVLGSAFVAYHGGGRAYLVTAHFASQAVVADAFSDLIVRRGRDTWRAQPVRRDKLTGFSVLRLEGRPADAIWTTPDRPRLRDGDEVVIVLPPQRDLPLVRGEIAVSEGIVTMDVPWNPLLLGAPVVTPAGRLAGVVTGIDPLGAARIAPIADACQKIRRCETGGGEQVERESVAGAEWLHWGTRELWQVGVELARTLWRSDADAAGSD